MPSDASTSSSNLLSALRQWAGRLRAARQRTHQRLDLARMSDAELKDLGIGRSEVQEWSRRCGPDTRSGAASEGGAVANARHRPARCMAGEHDDRRSRPTLSW